MSLIPSSNTFVLVEFWDLFPKNLKGNFFDESFFFQFLLFLQEGTTYHVLPTTNTQQWSYFYVHPWKFTQLILTLDMVWCERFSMDRQIETESCLEEICDLTLTEYWRLLAHKKFYGLVKVSNLCNAPMIGFAD